jgi:hypothetical protein
MQLIATPIAVVAAIVVAVLWWLITPMKEELALSPLAFLLSLAGCFVGIMIVHELIHAAAFPNAGRSPNSVLGFWPSRLLFYAHCEGELARNRFVAILLMPLAVISFVPLLIAAIAQVSSVWVTFISVFNALSAGGDLLGAGIVLFQIPTAAIVRNQGWRTYWRAPDEAVPSQATTAP